MKSRLETQPETQTPQQLLQDLRALVVEAEKMLLDSASEHSHEAIDALRVRFETAQQRLADFYTNAKTKVVAGAKRTDEYVHENPYQAMAVTLGVGIVIGVLLGRRTNK